VATSSSSLIIGLLLDGQVVAAVEIPPGVWRRMARRFQASAVEAGLNGPCQAVLHLLPQRGVPRLVNALRFCLTNDGTMMYMSDLPVSALDPLVSRQVAVLRHAGQLPADRSVSYGAFMSQQEPGSPFWARALPAFTFGSPRTAPHTTSSLFPTVACPDDLPIYINKEVLTKCIEWCQDRNVEAGGALLGHILTSNGRPRVEILAFAPAVGAISDATHLRFTSEAWSGIQRFKVEVEESLGLADPLQVVGWAHGHPHDVKEAVGTPFFLSPPDIEVMELSFAEPYACALVIDAAADPSTPLAESLVAFGWDGYGIRPVPRDLGLVPGVARFDIR
jgi:hypothetical protein